MTLFVNSLKYFIRGREVLDRMSPVDLDDNTPRRRCSYDRMRVSNLHGLLSSSLKRAPKQLRQKTYPARFQYVHGNVFPINKGTGVSVSPGDNKKCRSREVADYLYITSSKKASNPHGRRVAAVRTASAAAYFLRLLPLH